MGILSGNPKNEPMHYGEVYDVWAFSMAANLSLSCYQTYYNHAGDKDLKNMLQDLVDQCRKEIQECNEILKHNDIAPPPSYPEKPEAKLEDIPAGARFTDQEIIAAVTTEVAAGMVICSQVAGKCTREDIAAMMLKFHGAKSTFGTRALRMSKEKGWLMPPPLQLKRDEPVMT